MKATVTVDTSYCDKPYQYIGLVVTPGDGYTENDWLTVPVHIDCASEGWHFINYNYVIKHDTENTLACRLSPLQDRVGDI